ncbi:MAG: glycosyltransferase family 2 protein [Actinobacteria bacterium]|nr:glycosyltransferase family 2 protein [Actinomycetota bacterium]
MSKLDLSYVLPLRWSVDEGLAELTGYLELVAEEAEVIVVDGSAAASFEAHAVSWAGVVRHLRPAPELTFLNGKVRGVTTGVRAARSENVVVADDDVRYDAAGLERMARLLEAADLVMPQNYFDPSPFRARWDDARSLLNRALTGDFPGTLGVRRSFFTHMGGYDGDVLFENLELMRTVAAAGGRVLRADDLLVARRPPTLRHFLSQRVRQAYDDFAIPGRMALELTAAPMVALLAAKRKWPALAAVAMLLSACAEVGRRKTGAGRFFSPTIVLLAPGWAAERALTSWLAVGLWVVRGGCPYAGALIPTAAHSMAELRRRAASGGTAPGGTAPGPKAGRLVGAVTEGLDAGAAAPA